MGIRDTEASDLTNLPGSKKCLSFYSSLEKRKRKNCGRGSFRTVQLGRGLLNKTIAARQTYEQRNYSEARV